MDSTRQALSGSHMRAELESQPDTWARAARMTKEFALLPAPGARVAVVGCGTSWFMAQTLASLREAAGAGVTDAFAASEAALVPRGYDAVIALTRSGTTTEVVDLLTDLRGRIPTVLIVGDGDSEAVHLADRVIALPFADEQSVVQTRFPTTAIAFVRAALGEDLTTLIEDARTAISVPIDPELTGAEQYSFLGRGWTIGLAHEAALKMRETSQSWTESYSSMEYRHGPISVAKEGRVVWNFGPVEPGLADEVHHTGARFETTRLDPLADLIRVHRIALQRSEVRGLDADNPRNLTRSVILETRS